jgi:thiol-disulfide isomerase/thioredoxin
VRRRVLLPAALALCFMAGGLSGYLLSRPIRAFLRPLARQPPALESWIGRNLPRVPQWTSDGAQWSGPIAGAPALLVFWSTGCASCLSELPLLNAIGAELGDAVAIFGFPIQGDVDVAACVAARKDVHWPQLRGAPGELINPLTVALGVRRIPSLWIVDGNGVIRAERLERADQLLHPLQDLLGR